MKPYTLLFLYPDDGHGPETYQAIVHAEGPEDAYDKAIEVMAADFMIDPEEVADDMHLLATYEGDLLDLAPARPKGRAS